MSRILVIGGQGALGASVVQRLRSEGHAVVSSSRSCVDSAIGCSMDITDPHQVFRTINALQPSMIVHLAATFVNDYEMAFSVNVVGAKNVLAVIRDSGMKTRVVLAGSAAEYGVIDANDNPIQERQVLRPATVYGLTKSWQTTYGLMCAQQGMDVVVARIFNLEGPGLSQRLFIGRIDLQIEEVLAGRRERIEIGPLSAQRDYISVNQASAQIVSIAQRGLSGEVYHVASGKPVLMRDLLKERLRANGLDFAIVDEAEELSARVGYDVPAIYADISRTVALSNE